IANLGKVVEWDEQGQPLRMAGMNHDISDRKQAEAERLKAEKAKLELRLLEQILEVVLAGYWDWDIQNHSEYLSPGFKRMFGYQDHELRNIPGSWQSLIFTEDLPKVLDGLEQHFQSQGKTPFFNEVRCRHKDGSTIWVIQSGQVIDWDENGKPLRMIGCQIDTSNQKQTEAQVQRYAAQLEASNKELEAFAYSVSHDLRAPLRAIDGFSRALLEDYEDLFDAEAKDYFDRIRKNVAQMSQLIDDLLNLSRVSRSKIQYEMVNLSNITYEVLEQLQLSEPERQVEIQLEPDVSVYADATLMRVILTNLLQNAWKFTSYHSMAHIEFGVREEENQPTYFIRDDGAGFDMTYAQKLFGVFQRLHSVQDFPGTGIGLASVQRAIRRHGGTIWAEAAIEQGATFYFTIPSEFSSI
uniref:sensor histidine kinase n=1 Tax=Acaryochloris sp. IP29b_bin.148 TaxID=2969218 RepID=UPI00263520FA